MSKADCFFYSTGTLVRLTVMKQKISYLFALMLALASSNAVAAEAESIRHEIEVFFSSGIGTVVSIILLLLFLLWLLLPLAVFGLKSRLKDAIKETRETNRLLAEISQTENMLVETSDTNSILAEIRETKALLAEIRDEFTALDSEEKNEAYTERPSRVIEEESTAELYDEIKYDP